MAKNNLKAILYYEGVSIKELSTKLGVSYEIIRRTVNGDNAPIVYKAMAISDVLGYTVEEIFGSECPKEIIEYWNNKPTIKG